MTRILLFACAVVLSGIASSQVLAKVDDAELTWDDVIYMIGGEQNAEYLGVTSEASAEEILQSWVREELLVRAAVESGLESDPEVSRALEQARRQILLEAYMYKLVDGIQPSRLEVENYVDQWLETYKKRIHVQHIVVDDYNLAASILARIRAGADFSALASQYSIGPSAENGGDLGWIVRGQSGYMEFDEAAFRLDDGEVSDVVKTDAGYHIIKVLESAPLDPEPTLDDITEMVTMELTQAMQEEVLMQKVDSLRQYHDITLYPERFLEKF